MDVDPAKLEADKKGLARILGRPLDAEQLEKLKAVLCQEAQVAEQRKEVKK